MPEVSAQSRNDGAIGLTADQARQRLQASGAKTIADVSPNPFRLIFDTLWAPVPWMLEAAILLALALRQPPEAAVATVLLAFNAALSVFQSARSRATLDALKSRLALNATVKRDGLWTTQPAATLVVGDVVIGNLTLGAVVPADVRLFRGSILIDESMLTGESLPVEAGTGTGCLRRFTRCAGRALACVTATGERTKFGRTAELVRTAAVESTQQKIILGVVRLLTSSVTPSGSSYVRDCLLLAELLWYEYSQMSKKLRYFYI